MSTSIFDKHYLSVLGVKMLQGCLLSVTETREERRVIIINQHFTSQLSAVDNSGKLLQSGWANHSRETLYQSWCMCRWAITRHNGATTRLFAVDFHRFARQLIVSKPEMAPNETTSNKLLIGVNLRYQISALRSLANNQVSRLMLNRPTAYSTLGLNLLILRICCVTLSGLLIYRVQFRSVNWASPRPLVSGRLIWQDDD